METVSSLSLPLSTCLKAIQGTSPSPQLALLSSQWVWRMWVMKPQSSCTSNPSLSRWPLWWVELVFYHSILHIVHSRTAIVGLNSLLHFIPPTVYSPFLLLEEILPMSWGTWPVVGSTSTAMGSQSSCAKRGWSMLGSCSCWSRGSQELSPLNRYNRIHDG